MIERETLPIDAGCRSHERLWRGRCVDKGLKDDWLERLNALSVFDVISICEGHPDEAAIEKRLPHINLRLRDEHNAGIVNNWHRVKVNIGSVLGESFDQGSFRGHFEVRSGFASDKDGNEPVDLALLKISARFDLATSIGETKAEWFEKSIAATELFDKKLLKMITEMKK